jgi:hypothetical protein
MGITEETPYDSDTRLAMVGPPQGATAGSGGTVLSAYSLGRLEKLNTLTKAGFDNQSNYPLPKGVVDGLAYDSGFPEEEQAFRSVDSEASSGSGGKTLDVLVSSRKDKLRRILKASFTDNTSFGTPKGVVDTFGYANGFEDEEKGLGINISGVVIGPDGKPLSGIASIESDGESIKSSPTGGQFIISSPPPAGVFLGSNLGFASYDFRYTPSTSAIDYIEEGVDFNVPSLLVQYGQVEGKVTDYDGNPVSGAAVFGSGAGTQTNSNGEYSIAAPGGTEVDLSSLNGTETVTKTPAAGASITVDFQFSRLIINVVDPEFNPLKGTAVEIDGDSYTTDDEGRVVIDKVGTKTFSVVVGGQNETTVPVPNQGELVQEQFGQNLVGFRVNLKERDTQLPIAGTTVSFVNEGIASRTDDRGRASTISDVQGENVVVLGQNDRRYETKTVLVTIQGGEVKEATASLARRNNIPTI